MDFLSIAKFGALVLLLVAVAAGVVTGVATMANIIVDQPATMLTDAVDRSDGYSQVPGGGTYGLDWASLAAAPMRGIDSDYTRPVPFIAAFVSAFVTLMLAGFLFHWLRESVQGL